VAKVAPSLLADLEEVAEYFRGRADVEDVIEELGRTT
jgi:hypothetical protein